MSNQDARTVAYRQRVSSLSAELSSASSAVIGVESRPDRLDSRISNFPARIANIRKANYLIQSNLENKQSELSSKWAATSASVRSQVGNGAAISRSQLSALEGELRARSGYVDNPSTLNELEAKIQSTRATISRLESTVNTALAPIESDANVIEQGLSQAERTVELTQAASFKWTEGECPVTAVKAKDMNKDQEGVLTLTNRRIILESEKEIVLKKTLFFVTEKKKVREVALDGPIGSVNSLTKGRVGLLAGAGLYIEFKPQSGLQPLKLDTKSDEADNIVSYYGLITTGRVDDELAKLGKDPKKREVKVIACPRCGAPYSDEVYKGQTTVTCKYCGSSIPV